MSQTNIEIKNNPTEVDTQYADLGWAPESGFSVALRIGSGEFSADTGVTDTTDANMLSVAWMF